MFILLMIFKLYNFTEKCPSSHNILFFFYPKQKITLLKPYFDAKLECIVINVNNKNLLIYCGKY